MAEIVQITIGNVLRPNGSGSTTVVDNLLSTSATSALSANQGRVLKEEIDGIVQGGDAVTLQGQNGAYYLGRANHTGSQGADTITQDAIHRFATDAEKTAWNAKVDAAGASAAAPVQSVSGRTGAVTLVKADVGLSSVDNTSDADKPISTATAAALALKANTADLSTVATSGAYADLSGKPQVVVAATMPGDISGYADGTLFIIG